MGFQNIELTALSLINYPFLKKSEKHLISQTERVRDLKFWENGYPYTPYPMPSHPPFKSV